MKKRLPVGISDFKRIIDEGYYYVDKSLLIKELIDSGSQTILFPRPRRFGKTLNLSMLRYFYEKTADDTSRLFRELAIWQQGEEYIGKQGQSPVINLTFKDVKCLNWETCLQEIQKILGEEFRRHRQSLEVHLDPDEQEEYRAIIEGKADQSSYQNSLKKLSSYLYHQYGQRTIILIDEYDTPIQEGYLHGYYDEVISFMRHLLSSGLKDNACLEKGVLTGILRVAKESIFSDLNHLKVCSMLTSQFSQHFGLLEAEVETMLTAYGIASAFDEVRKWYNGYRMGDTQIYNPWSILNYVDAWQDGFRPYWVNTSSNDLIKQMLAQSGEDVKEDLECLLHGERIRKEIYDHTIFPEIENDPDALWSFLLFSGYLKISSSMLHEGILSCDLLLPNQEVTMLYQRIIRSWINPKLKQNRMMLEALVNGDVEVFKRIFQDFIRSTFSMFDTSGQEPEKVYHAFVLGLLVSLQDRYVVKSNRESGYGRYDVMLIPKEKDRLGIVIEFKKAQYKESLKEAVTAALTQIEEKQYTTELQAHGVEHVLQLGIAFAGKQVEIEAKR